MDWKTYYLYAGYRCGHDYGRQRRRERGPRVRRSIKIAMVVIPVAIAALFLIPIAIDALPGEFGIQLQQTLHWIYWSPFRRFR